jgi:chromosome segregation ATPase
MCASEQRWMVLLAAAALAWPAGAQNSSREAEQVRRLRQQLQQLQQEVATQQQAAQRAMAERGDVQRRLDAAQEQLKEQRVRLALQVRQSDQTRQALDAATQRQAAEGERASELQAGLEAERLTAAALRAELAQTQRQRGTLQDNYGELDVRHRAQAEGLQTCIARNASLQALGLELLQRYERKGWAEVLAADEPFLQWGRVSLENLVQGYRDKLDAQALVAPR